MSKWNTNPTLLTYIDGFFLKKGIFTILKRTHVDIKINYYALSSTLI